MKKLAILLALVLVVGLFAGCGDHAGTTASSDEPSTEPTFTSPDKVYAPEGITLLSCQFTQTVTALDKELITEEFPDRTDEVYVDMLFYISPSYFESGETMPRFSAKIPCGDSTYEMDYRIEGAFNTGFLNESLPSTGGYVHMFVSVPEAVMNMRLVPEVQYSIGINQYTCQIQPLAEVGELDNKTELSVGFKDSVFDGKVDFEVVDIRCANYLVATKGGESDRYGWFGANYYVDVVLKITNNFTTESIDELFGYIVEGNEKTRTGFMVETNLNTKLDDFVSIEPGQSAYVHMYMVLDETRNEVGVRFNFGGKLYYCNMIYTIEQEETITVHAYVPESWGTPGCWAWKNGGENVFDTWPGEDMNQHGPYYTIELPAWVNCVIINGNDGGIQTADISIEVCRDVWIVIDPNSTDYNLFYEAPTAEELAAMGY